MSRRWLRRRLPVAEPAAAGRCDDLYMGEREAVQAQLLISALREQMQQMAAELGKIERKWPATGRATNTRDRRPVGLGSKAADLRKDIGEAEMLIERLRRRYLGN